MGLHRYSVQLVHAACTWFHGARSRLAQQDLKWTINIYLHPFLSSTPQRENQPRFLVFQKILRTSHDVAQNHVGGALFDVSKVGLSTLKIHFF
jgi:hypothetical protein